MKKLTKFALTAALALSGVALCQPARAQSSLVYTDGDIFMGFHSATATNDYLWDLGQFSLYNNQPVGFHLNLTPNIATDLTTVFGTGWATDNTIQWGVAGTHDFDPSFNLIANLYATKVEPTVGVFAQPWQRQGLNAQIQSSSNIESMAYGNFFGNLSTANNPTGYIQVAGSTNSWAAWEPGGQNTSGGSFSTWQPTIEAPVLPGSGTGIPGTRLDLFEILPDNSVTPGFSKYLGTFSISSTGVVSYDVFAAVPEPSTYASVLAGAALLIVLLRFRGRSLNA